MTTENQTDNLIDVPAQIFKKFLIEMGEQDIPTDLVNRMRRTLLEDKNFTDAALNDAVLLEEQSQ